MKAANIVWDTDGEAKNLPKEMIIPNSVAGYAKHIDDIRERYGIFSGCVIGERQKWWYGIEGITFIFMGSWSDAYVGYKGYAINESMVSDTLWSMYKETLEETGTGKAENEEAESERFAAYVKERSDDVFEILDSIIESIRHEISEYIASATGVKAERFIVEPS